MGRQRWQTAALGAVFLGTSVVWAANEPAVSGTTTASQPAKAKTASTGVVTKAVETVKPKVTVVSTTQVAPPASQTAQGSSVATAVQPGAAASPKALPPRASRTKMSKSNTRSAYTSHRPTTSRAAKKPVHRKPQSTGTSSPYGR